ncbi:MAG: phosphate ABC transporter permease PstA [Planctomycetes bacterium]|nr:phosphate ABC transporter permease PstA [Planctomycetota bacterium]
MATKLDKPLRVAGEPWVWCTAMGLTLGMVMVVLLLGLIAWNGLSVFWPKRVDLVTLRAGSQAGIGGSRTLAGELVKRQERTAPTERGTYEIQLFVGNRDAYDFSFKYLDEADIESRATPPELMVIERMEGGDAIGTPVRLMVKGESDLAADAGAFLSRLRAQVEVAQARRAAILRVEKHEIGAINRDLEDANRALRNPSADRVRIDGEVAKLQQRYAELADQARQLRAAQADDQLILRLATGEERRIALGQIVDYAWPNQLSTWQRITASFHAGWNFLSENPREANTEGGIFPAIFGTFVMTLLMSVAVVPFGVVAAIYLREYAKQGTWVRMVRIAVNNLAGVPSIVFGVFGLGFFVYVVGGSIDSLFYPEYGSTPVFGTGGVLWASATMALMTVPVVIVATEEAIAAVPRGAREGSLACGASKWQTIRSIILPASAPGILTGLILAMARGAGEVAPLMLVGVVKLAPTLPVDSLWKATDVVPFVHLDQKFMHLGFHIYDLGFQSPDSEAAKPMVFATTLFLIVLVLVLNLGAILIRERLRRRYALGAF